MVPRSKFLENDPKNSNITEMATNFFRPTLVLNYSSLHTYIVNFSTKIKMKIFSERKEKNTNIYSTIWFPSSSLKNIQIRV